MARLGKRARSEFSGILGQHRRFYVKSRRRYEVLQDLNGCYVFLLFYIYIYIYIEILNHLRSSYDALPIANIFASDFCLLAIDMQLIATISRDEQGWHWARPSYQCSERA